MGWLGEYKAGKKAEEDARAREYASHDIDWEARRRNEEAQRSQREEWARRKEALRQSPIGQQLGELNRLYGVIHEGMVSEDSPGVGDHIRITDSKLGETGAAIDVTIDEHNRISLRTHVKPGETVELASVGLNESSEAHEAALGRALRGARHDNDLSNLSRKERKAYKREQASYDGGQDESWYSGQCLSGKINIDTPNGQVNVKKLKVGDIVWTVDKLGNKTQAKIIKKKRRAASKKHKIVKLVLEDGRTLTISPGHPTIDNRSIGNLRKGMVLDGSKISSLELLPYEEKYTYDILPEGDTGGYWANNILIGSTLLNI